MNNKNEIVKQLEILNARLKDQSDSSNSAELISLKENIDRSLQSGVQEDEVGKLKKYLEESSISFENEHPELSQLLSNVAAMLASVGI